MTMLLEKEISQTGRWIATQQEPSGEIYWWKGDKADPWNHTHAAMGLLLAGLREEADAAYRFLVDTQASDGGWPMERRGGRVVDASQDTNQAAYIATGAWFHYRSTRDRRFLVELWPAVRRAIDFVVSMQAPSGAISWVRSTDGRVWRQPLIAGSSSIYGSIVCAERIAAEMRVNAPAWTLARQRLGECLRSNMSAFDTDDLPERAGRYAMDWYYPVLGGALRGEHGRRRMMDPFWTERFHVPALGSRCVADDRKWFTTAESSELVMSYELVGLSRRAREIFSSLRRLRRADGGYWTGWIMPTGVVWPLEPTTYTAAAVLVADDALARRSATADFFHDLGDTDLDERSAAAS
jgi:hypothetical protein